MSIAITLKVNDGVVLAADSAATVMQPSAQGATVANVYNNANKVSNLLKGQRIGMISWGAGGIGSASIATLAKDLRRLFGSQDSHWRLDPDSYSVEWVAEKVREFMFEKNYQKDYGEAKPKQRRPNLGFVVAGYSAGKDLAEEYKIMIENGKCPNPERIRKPEEIGFTWNGQGEAIGRLVLGMGSQLPQALAKTLGEDAPEPQEIIENISPALQAPLIHPAMPIQDAIDLATFLVDATIKFYKYLPGPPSVGGPIEVAAITKHEGFKWIQRKYYYSRELNPEAKK